MGVATAMKGPGLVPADRLQRPQTVAFRPAGAASLTIDARGFGQMATALVLVPVDVLEELKELAMAAMRAFDRGAALVRLRITCLDAAFVFDRRRTGPDRLAVGEGAEAFVADRKRIAFLQRRILVHLVEQDLADRPDRKSTRLNSSH